MDKKGIGLALVSALGFSFLVFSSAFFRGHRGKKSSGFLSTVSKGYKIENGKGRVSFLLTKGFSGRLSFFTLGDCQLEVRKNYRRIFRGRRENIGRVKFKGIFKTGDRLDVEFEGKNCSVFGPFFRERTKTGPIFLIVADTMRFDSIGVYNPSSKATPEIDRFSRDSVVFLWAFSSSPWTLPSHAVMLSGKYSFHISPDIYHQRIPAGIKLVSQLLPPGSSLSLNGDVFVSHSWGFSRGFALYLENHQDPFIREAALRLFSFSKGLEPSSGDFLFLHTYQIHNKYRPELPLARDYWGEIGENPGQDEFDILSFAKDNRGKNVSPEIKRKIELVYRAGVYTFDRRFGEFIRWLRNKGLYEKSTIILTADHGEEFGEHGGWEHGHSLYNELIRVPLILKLPEERFSGLRVKEPVSLADILPTIFEIYGLRVPHGLDGISLLKTIRGKVGRRKIYSYLEDNSYKITPGRAAVIDFPWKLIMTKEPGGKAKFELYNLERDPWERVNLFSKEKEVSSRLVPLLRKIPFSKIKGHGKLPEELKRRLRSLGYVK